MVKALIPSSIPGDATVEGVTRGKVNFAALDAKDSPAKIRWAQLSFPSSMTLRRRNPNLFPLCTPSAKNYSAFARGSVGHGGGSWTAMHIIRDLPQAHREAYAQFFRSPC